ncbi:MAG: alpha/beta fold hydrolase, partial [Cumulibacter sp.]
QPADLSSSIMSHVVPTISKAAQFAPKWIEGGRKMLGNSIWLATRKYSFGSAGTPASLTDYMDRMISATPLEVMADFYPTLAGHDKLRALPAIAKAPVLVICGDEDRMTPIDHSELIARELPSADLFVVPGAGHMAILEKPELCNDQLLGFIRRVVAHPVRRSRSA